RAYSRRADGRRHACRISETCPCADRSRYRRRHSTGNRHQHPRRDNCGQARQDCDPQRSRALNALEQSRLMSSLLVRNGLVLTMSDRLDLFEGDVLIKAGRIAAIGSSIADRYDRVVDAHGGYVLPGLIQTHVHLCQTLFRGYADDLPLMDWLRRRVWPMEAAHSPATLRASARLAT